MGIDYHSSRFFALLFPALYLIAMSIFCLEYKIIPGAEFLVMGILIYAAYDQRSWRVLKDWLPFITVFVSYELMYSLVGFITTDLHSGPLNFDVSLLGQVPNLILQQTIRSPILDYGRLLLWHIFFCSNYFCYILLLTLFFNSFKSRRLL